MKYKIIVMLCAVGLVFGAAGCSNQTEDSAQTTEKTSDREQESGGREESGQSGQEDGGREESGQSGEESGGREESGQSGEESGGREESGQSGQEDGSKKKSARQVVVGGFELTLPEDVTPQVNDQGMILTDENMNYQMLVTVRDYAFDSKKKTPDFFAEKVTEAGYEVTKEVEITTVEKREFAYFNYIDHEDRMMLAYSEADSENTFGTLILRYGELDDKEFLKQTAAILASAQKTDRPDTTEDDIVEWNAADSDSSSIPEDAVKADTVAMMSGENEFTVSVPEDFYLLDGSDETGKIFISSDGNINAYLYGMEDFLYSNLKDWLRDSVNVPEDAQRVSKSEIMQEEVGGVTVYYQMVSYEEKSSYKEGTNVCLELDAAAQMPNGICLELKADSTEEEGLNFDMVKDFFALRPAAE